MGQVLSKPEGGTRRQNDVELYFEETSANPVTIRSVQHRAEYSAVEYGDVIQSYVLPVSLRRCWMPVFTLPTAKAVWYFSCAALATPEQIENRVVGVCILIGPLMREPVMREPGISIELVHPVGPIVFMSWLRAIPGDSTPSPFFGSIVSLEGDKEEEPEAESDTWHRVEPMLVGAGRTQSLEPRGVVTCIICMENPAEYKWYACYHESDGPSLACLRCRNAICAAALCRAKSTKKHQICSMCPVCRVESRMVRLVK